MKELMSFNKFKKIMDTLVEFQAKKDRISKFFEKEIMEDSWCIVTLGYPVEDTLVSMLADEFECWYSFKEDVKEFDWWVGDNYRGFENDIENWLYSLDEKKVVCINDKEIDISSIESLYDFLVSQYKEKHNLTE